MTQDAETRAQLVGSWVLKPGQRALEAELGRHAMLFVAGGGLVYSICDAEGLARLVLTWRVEGGSLVTDQPASPQEERTRFAFEGGELIIGGEARYQREAGEPLDPHARAFPLAAEALKHAVSGATAEEAFVPFLMRETPAQLELLRVLEPTPEAAEARARTLARERPDATAVAWVSDGVLTAGADRRDAALAEVSLRGVERAVVLAQAYRIAEVLARPEPVGGLVLLSESPSWLG